MGRSLHQGVAFCDTDTQSQMLETIEARYGFVEPASSTKVFVGETMRQVVNNYNQQKADFLQLFSSFFSSEAGDVNRGVASLASCISILEQYLGTDILLDAGYEPEEAKKKR